MYVIIRINGSFIPASFTNENFIESRQQLDQDLETFYDEITKKTSFNINPRPVNYIDKKNGYPFFQFAPEQNIEVCFYISLLPKDENKNIDEKSKEALEKLIQETTSKLFHSLYPAENDNERETLTAELITELDQLILIKQTICAPTK